MSFDEALEAKRASVEKDPDLVRVREFRFEIARSRREDPDGAGNAGDEAAAAGNAE